MTKRAESCLTGSLVHESVSNPHGYWQQDREGKQWTQRTSLLTLLIKGEKKDSGILARTHNVVPIMDSQEGS